MYIVTDKMLKAALLVLKKYGWYIEEGEADLKEALEAAEQVRLEEERELNDPEI